MSLYSLLRSPQVAQTCTTLSVPYAFPHLPQILLSALAFFLLQSFSRRVSPRIFPKHFKTFSTKTKLDWDLHFVRTSVLFPRGPWGAVNPAWTS
mgnify:FL=1